jgi:hypothetical protein
MKPMYEALIENFSTLAKLALTDGRTLVIAEGADILPISAIALILVFLTIRILQRKHGSFFKSFRAGSPLTSNCASGRFFEIKRIPAVKICPNCAEQLPLSALICHACDYNFLAARPERGQKLLPPPLPMTHEVSGKESRPRAL